MSQLVDLERIEFSGAREGELTPPDYLKNTRLQVVSQVAVRFMPANRVVYCDAGAMIVRPRERVIVETDKGTLTGTVVTASQRALREARLNRRLVRYASEDDERSVQRHQFKQAESFQFCLQRIRARNLPMKLVSVKYLHAGNKAIFYFSAEGRIDFRELVRDLAQRFRVRIEMRQIGIRDEAKIIGGIGPCGQQTCCSRYLQNFSPVTIKMAKTQNLVLNPQKVSGICGRLMCCLAYENEVYEELRKELPSMNERVRTSVGEGVVKGVMIIGKRVKVLLDSNEIQDFHIGDIECLGRAPRRTRPSREGEEAGAPGDGESRSSSERRRDGEARRDGDRRGGESRRDGDSRRAGEPRRDGDSRRSGASNRDGESRRGGEAGRDGESRRSGASNRDGESRRGGEAGRDGEPQRSAEAVRGEDPRRGDEASRDGSAQSGVETRGDGEAPADAEARRSRPERREAPPRPARGDDEEPDQADDEALDAGPEGPDELGPEGEGETELGEDGKPKRRRSSRGRRRRRRGGKKPEGGGESTE